MTSVLPVGQVLLGQPAQPPAAWTIEQVADRAALTAYRRLRRDAFVRDQALFDGTDADDGDDDPRTVVLIARTGTGAVLGGVRLGPVLDRDLGWWRGSRLVVDPATRRSSIGPALIRAACAVAEQSGVVRFDATVQAGQERLFGRLGWQHIRPETVGGEPHVLMRWPIRRFTTQSRSTKAALGPLLNGLGAVDGFRGDDGTPIPGTDVIAACDAIVGSLVERDPEWAGWCGVLVNVNDLAAMGATPVALLDAVAARDASFAARIVAGLRAAASAYEISILGGHTQLGVPAALTVTALGRTTTPIRGGGGRPGHAVSLTADLGGQWRHGHTGRQWDSSTSRRPEDLRHLTSFVARTRPAAAKDVSMAGTVGTLGMLAEASGCGAVLDLAAVPCPERAGTADWLSCFPGFAMITTDRPGRPVADCGPATTAVCGELVPGCGVHLRWPDGELTTALSGAVTGLGPA